jgi:uncharacterized protein YceK
MRYLKTFLVLFAFMLLSGCTSKKTTADAMTDTERTALNTKMMENGFKMGTIVASKVEGDCPYTIQLVDDNYSYYLDPINLDASFKKHGEKIWLKFAGLKMMNRCEKANPISIIEIQKREE